MLKLDKKNIKMIYLVLLLNIEAKDPIHSGLELRRFRKLEDCANTISGINKYMGYLAWSEIYLHDPASVGHGRNILRDLVKEYPQYPHAYM